MKYRKLYKLLDQVTTIQFPLYVLVPIGFFGSIFLIIYRAHYRVMDMIRDEGKGVIDSFKFGTYLFENGSLILAGLTTTAAVLTLILYQRESKKQNFRTNFFEYLKIHRENTRETETRGKKGHDAFIDIYRELKFIYDNFPTDSRATTYRIEWSYILVFYGLGETSIPITKSFLEKQYSGYQHEINIVITYFEKLRQRFNEEKSSLRDKGRKRSIFKTKQKEFSSIHLPCVLDGHQSDLGHYYRHLYQTVTFVDEFEPLRFFERYDYVKNIRAQFSNHEMVVFLANAYSPLGKKAWIDRGLIAKYRLIKNMPLSLFPWKNIIEDFPKIEFEN